MNMEWPLGVDRNRRCLISAGRILPAMYRHGHFEAKSHDPRVPSEGTLGVFADEIKRLS